MHGLRTGPLRHRITCCDHGSCADGATAWEGGHNLLHISSSTSLQNLCKCDSSWQQGTALNDGVVHAPAQQSYSLRERPCCPQFCQAALQNCRQSVSTQACRCDYGILFSPQHFCPSKYNEGISSGPGIAHGAHRLKSAGCSWAHLRELRPRGLSKLLSERSIPDAARLSPRVRAPRDCSRRATAAAKRFSPPRLVATSL